MSAVGGKPPLTLCFGVHDHQPAANFDFVFDQAADRAYLPFLQAAARHPGFRFSLHLSGGLLAWLERHRPAGVDLIGELVERGQVELMGGGFFEPILPAVPERDALGQLAMLSDHLERRFGRRPVGAWLAERVWEGRLAALLARAGFRYSVLDDHHFLRAGVPAGDLRGAFVTEREGLALRLFPIDQGLRYLVPFEPVEAILGRLREIHAGPGVPCVTYADDGEKFGLWPGTHPWVYGQGWLEGFLEVLERESGWIRTSTFADALEVFPPAARVYLPDASYREMTEWALPTAARARLERARRAVTAAGLADVADSFLAGGSWPQFLAKYPEGNLMHKKMLRVSEAVCEAEADPAARNRRRIGRLAEARRHLYRAQSNCAYWHGVFGGLYLGHLRHAIFADLLEAEDRLGRPRAPVIETVDFDRDGEEELWIRAPAANLLVAPASGGGIPLFELRQARMNLTNVLSRRPEAYHDEIREAAGRAGQAAEDPGGGDGSGAGEAATPATIHSRLRVPARLARELVYDPHPRFSALEHLLPRHASFASFRGAPVTGGGAPLPRYAVRSATARAGTVRVLLEREEAPAFRKEIVLGADGTLAVGWTLPAEAAVPADAAWLATEWSLFFFSGKDPGRRYVLEGEQGPRLRARLARARMRRVTLDDRPFGLAATLTSRDPFRLWAFPLNTVSRGEGGYETTYQGTCLALAWPLGKAAGERRFAAKLTWRKR